MRGYLQEEKVDMILVIGECEENCLLASRVYAQKYPNRRHPTKRSLEYLLQVFRRTGSVSYKNQSDKSRLPKMKKMNFWLWDLLLKIHM